MFALAVVVGVLAASEGGRVTRRNNVFASCGTKGGPLEGQANISIVNGAPATECEWRWQVGFWAGREGPWCGGTLISPDWVLTAAHCCSNRNFDVIAGDYKATTISSHQQRRKADLVIKHPGYNPWNFSKDIALVRVDRPFELSECVGTACLPSAGEDVPAGSTCWITGWGTLSSNGTAPTVLQEVAVGIISNAECTSKFGYSPSSIDGSMMCAQGRTDDGKVTDACQGDSGGPLVCEFSGQWAVYGATSWGRGCAGENYPGIWARIHEELDWITETMANPPTFTCPWYCSLCILKKCKDGCSFCAR